MKTLLYTYFKNTVVFIFLIFTQGSCEKFIAVSPPVTQIGAEAVFSSDATSLATLSGLYSRMMESEYLFTSGMHSITVLTGLSGDELIDFSGSQVNMQFYNNSLNGDATLSLWSDLYRIIYQANTIIEGAGNATHLSSEVKNQLNGEAKFIRAFCHFYLTNLFGAIPVALTTDYRINNTLNRSENNLVYDQIISDLDEARSLLKDNYSAGGGQKIRPNRAAATALLARVYLYKKDWNQAELMSSSIIDNDTYYLNNDIDNSFLANSTEAIWQLMPNAPGYNTFDGATFILTSFPNFVALNDAFVEQLDIADQRRQKWIGELAVNDQTYYYPYKYKIRGGFVVTEYLSVLRLAEQYLIRAEARAQSGDTDGALEDLNIIHTRAGLLPLTDSNIDNLLNAIYQERRFELFSEWGHRWFDLARTGTANEVLSPVKTGWQNTDILYPVPQKEISNNRNLLPQNPGY